MFKAFTSALVVATACASESTPVSSLANCYKTNKESRQDVGELSDKIYLAMSGLQGKVDSQRGRVLSQIGDL